jgi:hypothetical protein
MTTVGDGTSIHAFPLLSTDKDVLSKSVITGKVGGTNFDSGSSMDGSSTDEYSERTRSNEFINESKQN